MFNEAQKEMLMKEGLLYPEKKYWSVDFDEETIRAIFGHEAAEDEEIQYRDDGQQIHREGTRHYRQNKEYRVHQCEPFHLDRDDEEQQHLHIREKRRKGEEH